jgi:hypothetical protein
MWGQSTCNGVKNQFGECLEKPSLSSSIATAPIMTTTKTFTTLKARGTLDH